MLLIEEAMWEDYLNMTMRFKKEGKLK